MRPCTFIRKWYWAAHTHTYHPLDGRRHSSNHCSCVCTRQTRGSPVWPTSAHQRVPSRAPCLTLTSMFRGQACRYVFDHSCCRRRVHARISRRQCCGTPGATVAKNVTTETHRDDIIPQYCSSAVCLRHCSSAACLRHCSSAACPQHCSPAACPQHTKAHPRYRKMMMNHSHMIARHATARPTQIGELDISPRCRN